MSPRVKRALIRFAKVVGASAIAAALAQIPVIDFGHYGVFVPVVAGLLLAAEKFLQKGQ